MLKKVRNSNASENKELWFNNKELTISLTGKDSHKAIIDSSQGSFSIGVKGRTNGHIDAWVNENDVINWDAFNEFYTPYCYYECKDRYPFGDWPRFLIYYGNDTGFINWSIKRVIEDFYWFPTKNMDLDLTEANIYRLHIGIQDNKMKLTLGKNIYWLQLEGNLYNYKIKKCLKVTRLQFSPAYDEKVNSYILPEFKELKTATAVEINLSPLNQPFDCKSLLQFPNLKELYLIGHVINVEILKDFKNLEKIGIWDSPNLKGMPNLNTWKNLKEFIAINIDELAGRKFKEEIKILKKEREFKFVSISKLRDPLWFETNYGIPFSEWESKNEKKATSAYKICLKNIKKATTEEEIKNSLINFIEKINRLDNIETIERDDIYTAISIIMKNSPLKIETKKWESWFEQVREF